MRELLPQRRNSMTFELSHGGMNFDYAVTAGFYPDNRIGEIFIAGGKSGETIEAIARDAAVLMSIALQHGASLETLQHAITRNSQEEPFTIMGAVIDELIKHEQSFRGNNRDGDESCEAPVQTDGSGADGPISAGEEAIRPGGAVRPLQEMETTNEEGYDGRSLWSGDHHVAEAATQGS